jgi:hypothetical protein
MAQSRPTACHYLRVEHLHNTGSCKGELTVDKWLFSYRSTDRQTTTGDWKLTELKAAESKKPANSCSVHATRSRASGSTRTTSFEYPRGWTAPVLDYMNDRID